VIVSNHKMRGRHCGHLIHAIGVGNLFQPASLQHAAHTSLNVDGVASGGDAKP
jgi:hypothetical protein